MKKYGFIDFVIVATFLTFTIHFWISANKAVVIAEWSGYIIFMAILLLAWVGLLNLSEKK